MSDLLFFFIAVLGSGALFSHGFRQYTESMTRIFKKKIDRILQTESSGPLVEVKHIFDGITLGIISGSGYSGISPLVAHINVFGLSFSRSILLLCGICFSISFPLVFLTLFGFVIPFRGIAFLLLTLGLCTAFIQKRDTHGIPEISFGLGCSFLAIFLLNGYFQLIPYSYEISNVLKNLFSSVSGKVFLFVFGGLLTIIFRTYAATFIIALSLAFRGWIHLADAWLLLVAAFSFHPLLTIFATKSFSLEARRLALIRLSWHVLFTAVFLVLGILFLPVENVPSWSPKVLCFYTILGHFLCGIFLGSSKSLIKIISSRIKNKTGTSTSAEFSLQLIPLYLPESLESNLMLLKSAIAFIVRLDHEILQKVMNSSQDSILTPETVLEIRVQSKSVERYGTLIDEGLARIMELPCSPVQAKMILSAQHASRALQEIADSCCKIVAIFELTSRKKYKFHTQARDELFSFTALVLDFLKYNSDVLSGKVLNPDEIIAKQMEDSIDLARNKLKKQARKTLEGKNDADIRAELAFIDIIEYLEHIGDNCLIVSNIL